MNFRQGRYVTLFHQINIWSTSNGHQDVLLALNITIAGATTCEHPGVHMHTQGAHFSVSPPMVEIHGLPANVLCISVQRHTKSELDYNIKTSSANRL